LSSARPSIVAMMSLILVIALDCTVLRHPLSGRPLSEILLVLGVLPMANILAVGMLRLLDSRGPDSERRRRLTGFLCSGGGAMIAVVVLSIRSPEPLAVLVTMIALPVVPLRVPTFLGVAAAVVIFLVPQLGLALIGGAIYCHYGRSESIQGSMVKSTVNPPVQV
jgi:hypothetical protein